MVRWSDFHLAGQTSAFDEADRLIRSGCASWRSHSAPIFRIK